MENPREWKGRERKEIVGGRGKKKEENGESNREMNPRGRKKVENEKSRQRSPYCWKGLN